MPDELYEPPNKLPFSSSNADYDELKQQPDTNELLLENNPENRKHDFFIDHTNWTFLNHGAFGGALKCAVDRANDWRAYLETQPLRYFDRDLLPHLVYSNRQLADFVHGKKDSLVLIQNATVGLNAVIGGYTQTYQADSILVYWDVSYGSVKKMCQHYSALVGGTVVEIPFQDNYLPLQATSSAQADSLFVQAWEEAMEGFRQTHHGASVENALLVLDHTTSNTAINVPIQILARKAKQQNMLVLVDGAHGLLSKDIRMSALEEAGVDFYVGNCHKWLSAPRGAAMMYCPHQELRDTILRKPPVISHGVDDGFISRFLWDGCRDYAAELSLPEALHYWNRLDGDVVRRRMRDIMTSAVQILVNLWFPSGMNVSEFSTSGITVAPLSMHSPMALVKLPHAINKSARTSNDGKQVQDFLYENRVECPIKCINGVLYVRISCHIYNTPEEYERLGRVMLEFPGW